MLTLQGDQHMEQMIDFHRIGNLNNDGTMNKSSVCYLQGHVALGKSAFAVAQIVAFRVPSGQ